MTKFKSDIVLGFDFGMKRLGIAVGNLTTCTARPIDAGKMTHGIPDWSTLDKVIHEWQPQALVVGLPLNIDGSEQAVMKAARVFMQQLADHYELPVHEVDERYTTKAAREQVFKQGGYKALSKQSIDSVAAQIILESWLAQ